MKNGYRCSENLKGRDHLKYRKKFGGCRLDAFGSGQGPVTGFREHVTGILVPKKGGGRAVQSDTAFLLAPYFITYLSYRFNFRLHFISFETTTNHIFLH
jgi:hypothetical protein